MKKNEDELKKISQTRAPKLSYSAIRQFLKDRAQLYYHEDKDLKNLKTSQVYELMLWFLYEMLGVSQNQLLQEHDYEFFQQTHYSEKQDLGLAKLKVNILFQRTIGTIYYHITNKFEMFLKPSKFQNEWKGLLSLIVEFIQFKDAEEERYNHLQEQYMEKQQKLQQVTSDLHQQIDTKTKIEKEKQRLFDKFTEMEIEAEGLELMLDSKTELEKEHQKVKEEHYQEFLSHEIELNNLREKKYQLEQDKQDNLHLIVTSPDKLIKEKDLLKEEVNLISSELSTRKAHLVKTQNILQQKLEKRDKLREQLLMLQSGTQIKRMVQQIKRAFKKEQGHLIELNQQIDQIMEDIQALKRDEGSRQATERQYYEKYRKLIEEIYEQQGVQKLERAEKQQVLEMMKGEKQGVEEEIQQLQKQLKLEIGVQVQSIQDAYIWTAVLENELQAYVIDIQQKMKKNVKRFDIQ